MRGNCLVGLGGGNYISREAYKRGEMYGHGRLCVCCVFVCLSMCLSVPGRIATLLHRPGCNLGELYMRCPLVVQYWADFQYWCTGFVAMTT